MKSPFAAVLFASTSVLVPAAAQAQTTAEPSAAGTEAAQDAANSGEIIVTARKRDAAAPLSPVRECARRATETGRVERLGLVHGAHAFYCKLGYDAVATSSVFTKAVR